MKVKTQKEIHQDYVTIYDSFLRKCLADKKKIERNIKDCKENEQHVVKLLQDVIKDIQKDINKYEKAVEFHKRMS